MVSASQSMQQTWTVVHNTTALITLDCGLHQANQFEQYIKAVQKSDCAAEMRRLMGAHTPAAAPQSVLHTRPTPPTPFFIHTHTLHTREHGLVRQPSGESNPSHPPPACRLQGQARQSGCPTRTGSRCRRATLAAAETCPFC